MQVSRKSIRDFVGDVRSKKDTAGNPLPVPTPAPNIAIHPTITRSRMWGKGNNQPLEVDVYSIAPGEEDTLHYHPDHIELVICWRGRGTAIVARPQGNGWEDPALAIELKPGDSLVVPKGALHSFTAKDEETMALLNPAKPVLPLKNAKKWPVEKLELVVIHPHGCVRIPDVNAPPANPPFQKTRVPTDIEAYALKRPIGDFCGYARDTRLQCVRARIWGREAENNFVGSADDAKTTLHFTAYTFVPGQENPEHFHPNSVEFVMCLQGRAKMTVRPPLAEPGNFKNGWEDPHDVVELTEGDTVLVPIGALHWYANASNEDCVLTALQSPHPILHILEDDAVVDPPAELEL